MKNNKLLNVTNNSVDTDLNTASYTKRMILPALLTSLGVVAVASVANSIYFTDNSLLDGSSSNTETLKTMIKLGLGGGAATGVGLSMLQKCFSSDHLEDADFSNTHYVTKKLLAPTIIASFGIPAFVSAIQATCLFDTHLLDGSSANFKTLKILIGLGMTGGIAAGYGISRLQQECFKTDHES